MRGLQTVCFEEFVWAMSELFSTLRRNVISGAWWHGVRTDGLGPSSDSRVNALLTEETYYPREVINRVVSSVASCNFPTPSVLRIEFGCSIAAPENPASRVGGLANLLANLLFGNSTRELLHA
jgi:hypothetical protein